MILLIFITLLEFIAFGWLIVQMRKSGRERDKIIKLEERQIAMERRILKTLDVNQLAKTHDLAEFLDHISIEGNADVNLKSVFLHFQLNMKIKLFRKYKLGITGVPLLELNCLMVSIL